MFEPDSHEENCQQGMDCNGWQPKFSHEFFAKAQVNKTSSGQQIVDEHRPEARQGYFNARPASNA
jgi:hypothetical protein